MFLEVRPDDWLGWVGRQTYGRVDDRGGRPGPGCSFSKGRARGRPRGEAAEPSRWPSGPSPDLSALRRRCRDLQNAWHFHKTRCERAAKIKSDLFAIVPPPNTSVRVALHHRRMTSIMCAEMKATKPSQSSKLKKRKERKKVHSCWRTWRRGSDRRSKRAAALL